MVKKKPKKEPGAIPPPKCKAIYTITVEVHDGSYDLVISANGQDVERRTFRIVTPGENPVTKKTMKNKGEKGAAAGMSPGAKRIGSVVFVPMVILREPEKISFMESASKYQSLNRS